MIYLSTADLLHVATRTLTEPPAVRDISSIADRLRRGTSEFNL